MTTINAVGNGLAGSTGSGNFVGATSPTLITPVLGVSTATSINFGGSALSTYQTGTWTPVLNGSGGGSATYAGGGQIGGYTQIGNRIFYDCYIVISASTLSGSITISGLPVAAGSQNFAADVWANSLGATATPSITCLLQVGSSSLTLWVYAAGTASAMSATNLGSTASLVITGSYHI